VAITKLLKPKHDYITWDAAELTNGDIIGVTESLGRPAKTTTVLSTSGDATIRLNVTKKIFKNQNVAGNSFIADAAFHQSPQQSGEVEDGTVSDFIVLANTAWEWSDLSVTDIKIVAKSAGLKIIVH